MDEKSIHNLYPEWTIVRKIGSGSFGTVFEIQRDLYGNTEKSALKCITIPQTDSDLEELYANGYDDASITAQFETYLSQIVGEYSMMAEMKGHSNVVYCDDIRYAPRENGIGWDITIKMELLTPLLKTLESEIKEDTVIRLGKDMCEALILCKEKKVVHRDIKPQNIFVSKTGAFKLGDFGIAKTVEKTTGGTKIGTYNYMAPEVYNNQEYHHPADIYSLGLVMYWMMNNRRLPFLPQPPQSPTATETEQARRRRFKGEKLPAPQNGSDGLKQIILKACAFDPNDRFASAQDMLEALRVVDDPAALRLLLDNSGEKTERIFPDDNGGETGGTVFGDEPTKEDVEDKDDKPDNPPEDPPKNGKKKIALIAAGVLLIALLCCIPYITGLFRTTEAEVILPETGLMGVGDHVAMPFEVKPEAEDSDLLHWESSDETILRIEEGILVGQAAGEAEVTLEYQDAADSCRIFVFGAGLGDQLLELTDHDWYYSIENSAGDRVLFRIDGEIYLYDGTQPVGEEQQSKLELAAAQELGEYSCQDRNHWLSVYSDAQQKHQVGSVVWAENAEGVGMIVVHEGSRTYLLDPEKLEDPAAVTVELVLSETALTLEAEETITLEVTGIQADGSEVKPEGLEWTSSDETICTVEDGTLTALAAGTAEITVTNGQLSAGCQVTVTAPEEEEDPTEKPTTPKKENQGSSGSSGNSGNSGSGSNSGGSSNNSSGGSSSGGSSSGSGSTEPKPTTPTEPKPTEPKPTDPPATEPPATQPPATEPAGKAPTGYSISLSTSSIILYEQFTVRVVPDVTDYTKIVIHAIDPTGGRWDFTMSGTNSKTLYVDDPSLVGTWKIYADVYNEYGVYYGSSGGPYATLKVIG